MAVFRVDKNKDYTIMSNYHLRDKTLSIKAKGLLSLMLSLPDDWDYTLKGLAAICSDGIYSIRATVNELEDEGYLKRGRLRNSKGQLAETEYTILEKPNPLKNQEISPICGNRTLDKRIPEKPICGFPTLDNHTLGNLMLGNPTLGNCTQSNTNLSNTKKQNTNKSSINQSINQSNERGCFSDTPLPPNSFDMIDKMDKSRKIIHQNIEYDVLTEKHDAERIDEFVELMVETICTSSINVRIGKSEYPVEVIRAKLLKVQAPHIEYVLTCLETNTSKIINIRSYLLTALCNSLTTIENYYRAEVNHDLAQAQGGNTNAKDW